jgi:hypothetical protein
MVLALTSLMLGTNAVHALFKHYIIYGLAFLFLTTTSLLLHTCKKDNSTYHKTLFWLDQIALLSVFLIGLYYAFQISGPLFIIAAISISICVVYYYYGYLTNQFCWDPENGTSYHGLMHVIGSFGHHAIIAGLV